MEKLNLSHFGRSELIYDPAVHGKMRADTINSLRGDMPGYDCPKCLNRGMHAFFREDGSIFTRPCDCMKIRRCVREMEKSGLKNVIREMTFEAFQTAHDWQKTIKAGAMAYADKADGWLLFCGQSGSGKTHLCSAVCRQRLLSGDEVRYMSWRENVAIIKGCSLDSERRGRIMEGFKNAQILYIDDLYKVGRGPDGTVNPSSADVSLAFEIINYRYINHLATIVSTELLPEKLIAIDEATGSRILEMAGQRVYAVSEDQRRNYRLRSVVSV